MKMKKYLLLIAMAFPFITTACGDKEKEIVDEVDKRYAIQLHSPNITDVTTRASLTDFPNGGEIGILAAYYNNGNTPVWTSYPDIDRTPAVATEVTNDVFSFDWKNGTKYWPFDGASLVFAAYSPMMGETGSDLYLSSSNETMYITLHKDMPDVLYASNNYTAKTTPYNKTKELATGKPKVVDLGEFRHALSKLTIEIYPDTESSNPNVRATYLSVSTLNKKATMNLFEDEGLQPVLGTAETTPFEYVLIPKKSYAQGLPFDKTPISMSVFLFNSTERVTEVKITFSDHPDNELETIKILSEVPDVNQPGEFLTLQKGMNTTLRFTVKSTEVIDPNEDIILQGAISNWYEAGDFGITIR